MHEGGVQFHLWPTTAFFEKHNLQRKGIKTKIYGSLHHFNTGFEGFKQLRFDPDSQKKFRVMVRVWVWCEHDGEVEIDAGMKQQLWRKGAGELDVMLGL